MLRLGGWSSVEDWRMACVEDRRMACVEDCHVLRIVMC